MASNTEDLITRYSPPLGESLTANLTTDNELTYDIPIPNVSPSPPHETVEEVRSVLRARLEPILTSPGEVKPIRKKKKRRKVLKQSPSVHIESVLDTTLSRPLPPLERDDGVSERPIPTDPNVPTHHLATSPHIPYEPVQLVSQEDICTENSLIGNPISSQPPQGQLMMRSDKAFVERKDGRFVPLTKHQQPAVNTGSHPWSVMGGVSRVKLARGCNAVFNTLGLMAYSLLAGVSVWHTVFLFILASYTNRDLNLIANLSKLSLPSDSLFYLLSSLAIVYVADRIDVVRLNGHFIRDILKLRRLSDLLNIIALFLTSISLIITLCLMYLDLRVHYFSLPHTIGWRSLWTDLLTNSSIPPDPCPTVLYTQNSEYFVPTSNQPISEGVTVLKVLMLIRAVLNLSGWVMVVSCPTHNRWYAHLSELTGEESDDV